MPGSWIDQAPLPVGVLRAGVFVYANKALLDLLGMPWTELDGQGLLERVAPEDRARVGDRHERRMRGEPVPDSYELLALRADGAVRSVEIWVQRTGPDEVMFLLADRTARARHQRHLDGLARLGASVQLEQTAEDVFAAIGRGLSSMGVATVRLAPRGEPIEAMRFIGVTAPGDLVERFHDAAGDLSDFVGVWGPGSAEAWREGGAHFDDMPLAAARFFGGGDEPPARAVARLAREANLARGVILRIDAEGQPSELLLLMADWLLPEDVPACRLFAAQVSAALDTARAIRAERGRNAALIAQTRIASFARAAGDLDVLFSAGAAELAGVLGCDGFCIHLVDDARQEAVLAHCRCEQDSGRWLERMPLADTHIGAVVSQARPGVLRADTPGTGAANDLLEALGARVLLTVPLTTRGKVIGVMSATYASLRPVGPAEIELMEAAGAHFASAVDAQRLFADLRSSYAELARAQEQLVQRERLAAIGELSAVVAHEVRNPLGVLFNSLGAFRKLLGDDVRDAASTLLQIMEEEAARLNHIVRDLLDFARPTHPTLHGERLDQVLDEAVEAAIGESAQDIEVVREIAELPLVPMDARLVRQALLNVATNAVHAMPDGGRITLRLALDGATGVPMAKVAIEDTGPGIAPEVAARIFEPFFTTRATGTGLGLAVVKRIVDSHHGKVRVDTALGHGTTFTLWLPLDEPAGS
jgi:PAS domain S-box-containing protein